MKPNAVWCISLEAMPQKWRAARERLKSEFPSVDAFPATDLRQIPLDALPLDVATKYRRRNGRKRKHHHEFSEAGAVGCFESHVKAWKRMLDTPGLELAVIFEDDAVASHSMRSILEDDFVNLRDANWDVLLLGYIQRYPTEPSIARGTVRITHPFFGLHAYAIRRTGAEFLLSHVQYPLTAQLDGLIGMLANLHRDKFVVLALSRGSIYSQLQNSRSTTQSATYDCHLCDYEESCSANELERRSQSQRMIVAMLGAFLLGLLLAGAFALGFAAKKSPPSSPLSTVKTKTRERQVR